MSSWSVNAGAANCQELICLHSSPRHMTKAALMAAITAALAWVVFPLPFSTVPVSGQTVGVMAAGILLPPRWAALSMVVYVLLGAVGLPVYAGGGAGIGVLAGPTGGYIWAFIPSALFISWGLRQSWAVRAWSKITILVVGGIGLIYIPGVLQLMAYTGLGFSQALLVGALPFLLGDALKILFCWWLAGHPAAREERLRS